MTVDIPAALEMARSAEINLDNLADTVGGNMLRSSVMFKVVKAQIQQTVALLEGTFEEVE